MRRVYLRHDIALRDGDCVIDVGANIGMFCLFACDEAKLSRVLAFEPIPTTCELLRDNVELYQLPVEAIEVALGEREEFADFGHYPTATIMSGQAAEPSRDKTAIASFLTEGGKTSLDPVTAFVLDHSLTKETVRVRVRRLDDVMRELGVERVDLLKIDVERGELGVLRGLDNASFAKIRQVVIEVHDEDGRLAEVRALLEHHGFRAEVDRDEAMSASSNCTIYAVRTDSR